jgi:protein TonB
MVEQNPTFPGGQGEIIKYLSTHLRYPAVAREMQAEAEITVTFVIDKTGFVRSPKVVEVKATSPIAKMTEVNNPNRTVNTEFKEAVKDGDVESAEKVKAFYDTIEALKEEAVYVVRNMPRWEPGRQNGRRVETTYTLPVSFNLAKQ